MIKRLILLPVLLLMCSLSLAAAPLFEVGWSPPDSHYSQSLVDLITRESSSSYMEYVLAPDSDFRYSILSPPAMKANFSYAYEDSRLTTRKSKEVLHYKQAIRSRQGTGPI